MSVIPMLKFTAIGFGVKNRYLKLVSDYIVKRDSDANGNSASLIFVIRKLR